MNCSHLTACRHLDTGTFVAVLRENTHTHIFSANASRSLNGQFGNALALAHWLSAHQTPHGVTETLINQHEDSLDLYLAKHGH